MPETSEGEQDNGEKDNQEEETEQRIWNVRSCLSIRPKEWEGRNLNFKYLPSREECETLLEREGDHYGPIMAPSRHESQQYS